MDKQQDNQSDDEYGDEDGAGREEVHKQDVAELGVVGEGVALTPWAGWSKQVWGVNLEQYAAEEGL